MSVALEIPVEFQGGFRTPLDESADANGDIEQWELHSELVLVCPEVCKRALELLPERDPYAFLARSREPILFPTAPADEEELELGLPETVVGYAFRRILDTAQFGLFAIGGLVALASLAELLH
jgi:hypothetical protein